MAEPRDYRAFHPFVRLNALLEGIAPGPSPLADGSPVMMQIGEPRRQPPAFVAEALTEAAAGWSSYPPPRGQPGYLKACADWLNRRFGLPEGLIDPAANLLPVPGTREGLFFAALALVPKAASGEAPPAILLPNPFYQVYAGAAVATGAEAVFVPSGPESGNLPDLAAVDPADLDRAALCYYCSPSNPQGAVADKVRLAEALALARRHDFTLVFDECYCELYFRDPPSSILEVAAEGGGSLDHVLAFHSLSKRSSAAGLRCGFAAGDRGLIDALDATLRVGGAGVPIPVLAAGKRLWEDDGHVAENRAFYKRNYALAEEILGQNLGPQRAAAGFFLWLPVEDSESFTKRLWAEAGIKLLPGTYMTHAPDPATNPGRGFVRAALIYDPPVIEAALSRLRDFL